MKMSGNIQDYKINRRKTTQEQLTKVRSVLIANGALVWHLTDVFKIEDNQPFIAAHVFTADIDITKGLWMGSGGHSTLKEVTVVGFIKLFDKPKYSLGDIYKR